MGIRKRRARKQAKTHAVPFTAAGVLAFLGLLAVALVVSLGALVETWLQDLPDYTSADAYLVAEPSTVYDNYGNTIATFYLENRRSITIDQVSDYVLKGTVDVEDERFYQHSGIDPIGIMRAVVAQLSGRSEGASTITQQLVRNTVLSDEQFDKTLKRKVREAYIAVEMEKTYTKEQILMMYLNTIYYGHSAYGIESAANTYFNKSAADLTLAEAALLVGLPNSPSYYDPTVNPEAAVERRNKVLDNMLRCGDITQEEHDAAQAEELQLNLGSTASANQGTYPFWTNYVKGLLEEDFSTETIVQSGLKIYTTLDPTVQDAAQSAVNTFLEESGADSTLDQALVAIDPNTGYIKAMIGGRDFYADYAEAEVNAATSARQPGSSFKVMTLVAAINAGMDPNTYINCNSPVQVTEGVKVQNYNNTSYGTRTLAEATAVSSNTGYVQVGQAVGVEEVVSMAYKLGIDSNLDAYISTVLGAEEVTPLEMAEAYATLAAGGVHRDPCAIVKIEDRNGNVVYEHEDNPTQVIDAGVARAATDCLETVISSYSGTAYNMNSLITFNQPIAGKTGTTEYYDNLWFCGYTPQLALSCWTGYKSGSVEVTMSNFGQGHPINTSCRTAAYFLNTVLSGAEYQNWSFADAAYPTYKESGTWKFSNTSVDTGGAATDAASADAAQSTEAPTDNTTNTDTGQTNGDGGNTGGDGGNTGGDTVTPTPVDPTPVVPDSPSDGGDSGEAAA